MQNAVDLWILIWWSLYWLSISSAKRCGFVDFWKYENQDPKSHSNCAQNAVDLWIFILTYTSALSVKKH